MEPSFPFVPLRSLEFLCLSIDLNLVAAVEARGLPLENLKFLYDELKQRYDDLLLELEESRDNAKPPSEKSLRTRERNSLLTLVAGVTKEQYNFDPSSPYNQAASQIVSDLANHGLKMDQGTVLKWLREAAELLPGESL